MLRAEHCICGTTSTGTGTLALTACPAPPGGTDLYQAFNAMALGTAVGTPISYAIVEYTDTTFRTVQQQEKGIGTLTLGANIDATTLARTTVQQTATGMDMTATYDTSAPTAITIALAAHTLVFVGASSTDLFACSSYFDVSLPSSATLGALPVNCGGVLAGNVFIPRNTDNYFLFEWRVPIMAKRLKLEVTGRVTAANALYGRIYAIGPNARPTKLLYNFGTFVGGASTTGIKATATGATGFFLAPGEYYMDITGIWSGGVSEAILSGFPQSYNSGRLGYVDGLGVGVHVQATSASSLAGDPANITGIDFASGVQSQIFIAISTT
jgi:hypothetical protein